MASIIGGKIISLLLKLLYFYYISRCFLEICVYNTNVHEYVHVLSKQSHTWFFFGKGSTTISTSKNSSRLSCFISQQCLFCGGYRDRPVQSPSRGKRECKTRRHIAISSVSPAALKYTGKLSGRVESLIMQNMEVSGKAGTRLATEPIQRPSHCLVKPMTFPFTDSRLDDVWAICLLH